MAVDRPGLTRLGAPLGRALTVPESCPGCGASCTPDAALPRGGGWLRHYACPCGTTWTHETED